MNTENPNSPILLHYFTDFGFFFLCSFFKRYIFSLIKEFYDIVTSSPDSDDPLLAYKRIDITTFACRMGYMDCVERSISLFQKWMNETNPDIVYK